MASILLCLLLVLYLTVHWLNGFSKDLDGLLKNCVSLLDDVCDLIDRTHTLRKKLHRQKPRKKHKKGHKKSRRKDD